MIIHPQPDRVNKCQCLAHGPAQTVNRRNGGERIIDPGGQGAYGYFNNLAQGKFNVEGGCAVIANHDGAGSILINGRAQGFDFISITDNMADDLILKDVFARAADQLDTGMTGGNLLTQPIVIYALNIAGSFCLHGKFGVNIKCRRNSGCRISSLGYGVSQSAVVFQYGVFQLFANINDHLVGDNGSAQVMDKNNQREKTGHEC